MEKKKYLSRYLFSSNNVDGGPRQDISGVRGRVGTGQPGHAGQLLRVRDGGDHQARQFIGVEFRLVAVCGSTFICPFKSKVPFCL